MINEIVIIGLGAGDLDQLPLGVYKLLKKSSMCYVRTIEHPVISELQSEGMAFESFDAVYEKHDGFSEVYEEISDILLDKAKSEAVLYAVPGHPMVAEKTVQLLLEKGEEKGIKITVSGGQSFLDALFQSVKIDPIEGFQLLDGTALKVEQIHIGQHMIIGQVYDAYVASDVKLTLMEKLPDDHEVFIVTAAGSKEESVRKTVLYELDRHLELNNLTSVYVPPVKEEEKKFREFSKLKQIIARLRGPGGCPWDQKQTHESLKTYLIEEVYELIDAIDSDDVEAMIGELGDVLLQVMLHAQIGEDEGLFSIEDVIEEVTSKMVRRHPHVFGDVEVNGVEEVLANWQDIKEAEKESAPKTNSLLDDIGKALPNLIRANEYQRRAANAGFDWDQVSEAWDKVKEEVQEVEAELHVANNRERIKDELGDLFFALVNVTRFYGIQAEEAVHAANQKFYRRFSYIEECVARDNKQFADYSLAELDKYWDEAKSKGL